MTKDEFAARQEIVRTAVAWADAIEGHNHRTDDAYVPRAAVLASETALKAAVRELKKFTG